ncbi:MAG: TonB-dependent receptor [Alphaproteobacteria bacterium]|nr:MAG: TonB-dependent receptor [Alphaproteobacteria bacterium]
MPFFHDAGGSCPHAPHGGVAYQAPCLSSLLRTTALALPLALAGSLSLLSPALADDGPTATSAEDTGPIEEIEVVGRRLEQRVVYSRPVISSSAAADSAALLRALPGADFVRNGPLTGQSYYRGLSGIRLGVKIDGADVLSGGPNLMDPPLHYVPPPLVERLEVRRGIAPVSAGPGLGGDIEAITRSSRFLDHDGTEAGIAAMSSWRRADDGFTAGGIAKLENRRWRAHVIGSYEDGDDLRFPGGRILGSSYRRKVVGAGFGLRFADESEFGVDYRYQDTDPTGTPALPLDIRLFHSHLAKAHWQGRIGDVEIDARLNGERIAHAMDNFSIRTPPPSPAMFRIVPAEAHGIGWRLAASFDAAPAAMTGRLQFGFDGRTEDHDADITNPNNAGFFIRNFNNARADRFGLWGEWQGTIGERTELLAGVRYDHVVTNADPVFVSTMLPPPVKMLASAFNTADRRRTDDLIDGVMRVSHTMSDRAIVHLGVGHKTRAPFYVERYAWLPLEITAGLADGNNHIGRIDLKPERSWVIDGGVDLAIGGWRFEPRVFWRRVHDYIQGLPFDDTPGIVNSPVEMVSRVNGDPTPLVYSNVAARFYGFDARLAADLTPRLRLAGVIGYTRGQRRDVKDNLYRIAPARALLSLTWHEERWSIGAETRLVAHQRKVSRTNDELPTGGYAIVNLLGTVEVLSGLRLAAGIENLFDRRYEEHLGGFNRVRGSDVPLGARLPGAGINGFVRLEVTG